MSVIEIPANALVILIGPPGSGKSTLARRLFRETEVVSSDECRRLVSDDAADQSATPQAFEVFHALVRGRLSLGRLTVADATHVHPDSRALLRAEAARHGAPTVVLAVDVPLEVCQAQNRARERRVRPEVIEMHYARYEEAKEALPGEGYDAIHFAGPDVEVVIGPARVKEAPHPGAARHPSPTGGEGSRTGNAVPAVPPERCAEGDTGAVSGGSLRGRGDPE